MAPTRSTSDPRSVWSSSLHPPLDLQPAVLPEDDDDRAVAELLNAALEADLSRVKKLVKELSEAGKGVDEALAAAAVGVTGTKRRGPLHMAATNGNAEMCRFLTKTCDPNKVVHYDHSPLTMACCARSLKCVKLLTQAGADVNSKSPHELPVLMIAVNKGLTDIVKFLLEVGADPNIPDMRGNFPIMLAAGHEHRELVEILFLQTKPIPLFPDWSVDGIIRAMKYLSFEPQESVEEQISVVKSKGKEAFAKGDYVDAAYSYMLAMTKNPHDATLFANRSLRWPRLREGERALSDAQHCKTLRPRWAKAWYREGMALSFLKEHKGAVYAFEEALKLDPANHDIKKALREAMESTKNAACLGEQDPQVAACVRSD